MMVLNVLIMQTLLMKLFSLSDRIGPQCCERKQLERPEDGGDRKETHRDWNQEEFQWQLHY